MNPSTESTPTLATPANMRRYAELHPGHDYPQGDGTVVHVEARRCEALDPITGDTFSASAGDYWQQPDDEPLTNSVGDPLLLVTQECRYVDALTGEVV